MVAYNEQTNAQLITAANNVVTAIGELTKVMQAVFPASGGTAGSATSGAATLPANPVGFLEVQVNGQAVMVPYYNP